MFYESRGVEYFGKLTESKAAAVAPKGVTNPDVMKTRYIPDTRIEVNSRITNDRRTRCAVPRHAIVDRLILYWGARYPGIPVLISRRDVKGACKLIPVSVRGLAYMGCLFAKFVFMYLSLFF